MTSRKSQSFLLLLGFLFSFFNLQAKMKPEDQGTKIKFNYNRPTSLLLITRDVMDKKILSKSLVYKEALLNNKVTILNPQPVSKAWAKSLYITALNQRGLALVETKNMARIIPKKEALSHLSLTETQKLQMSDELTTTLIRLGSTKVSEIYSFLIFFLSGSGTVVKLDEHTIILSGLSAQLKKLIELTEELNQKTEKKLHTIELKNYPAEEAVSLLKKLGLINAKKPYKILVATEENALILYGKTKDYKKIERVLSELDKKRQTKQKGQYFYVRPLEFAKAEKTAKLLMQLKTKRSGPTKFVTTFSKEGSLSTKEDYNIVADDNTNTLIIDSSYKQYKILSQIIRKIDKKQAQIFFDVNILEISEGFKYTFKPGGLGFFNKASGETSTIVGWESQEIMPLLKKDDSPLKEKLETIQQDLVFGIIKNNTVSLDKLKEVKTGAMIKLLSQDNYARLMSSPFLLSNEGNETSFTAGQVYPYKVTKQQTNTFSGKSSPTIIDKTTIEKESAELSMKIKAHSKGSQDISLKINLDISSLLGFNEEGYPLTNKRKFEQEFLLRHGQTLFMAGFSSSSQLKSSKKIPILGDIPLLGKLFENRNPTYEKKKLIIFITPYICWGPNDLMAIYQRKTEKNNIPPSLNKKPT